MARLNSRIVRLRRASLAATGAVVALSGTSLAHFGNPLGVDESCFAPTPYIDPMLQNGVATNPQWIARDQHNQYCSTLRLRDQIDSPAYGNANRAEGGSLYLEQATEQAGDAQGGHIHGGFTTLIPGSQAADAFRTVNCQGTNAENTQPLPPCWQALTGGRVSQVAFTALDGAQLRGHIFLPPDTSAYPPPYPGIVITDGSIQAFENLYFWAAEGLAQYGYEVLTFDVQGQGDSDLFPAGCPSASNPAQQCQGVPYQQNYNFYQGSEDALNFFLSSANPGYADLNTSEVGIAGHSLGAAAVSWVGQCDSRVRAVVAWDDLVPMQMANCANNVTVPAADQNASPVPNHPSLALTNDYEFNPQTLGAPPNPHGSAGANAASCASGGAPSNTGGGLDGDGGYQCLVASGTDSEQIAIRNGTHLTYTYVPYVLPANELGERIAFYYTLAWFDQYLRGGADAYTAQSAYNRLTNVGEYDSSSDSNDQGSVSIGAGTFSALGAVHDPTNEFAGNTPYAIDGLSIPDSLSFYYLSEYSLHNPGGALATCGDLRNDCVATSTGTP